MSEPTEPSAAERPEIVLPQLASADGEVARESVEAPAKVMRIGSMIKQLLDEVRAAPLDEASRDRLAQIYETSVMELSESLSPDLQEELARLLRASVIMGDEEMLAADLKAFGCFKLYTERKSEDGISFIKVPERASETNGAGVTSSTEAVLRNASRKICDHGPWIVRGASITRSLSRARGFFHRIIWCKAPGPVKFPAAA